MNFRPKASLAVIAVVLSLALAIAGFGPYSLAAFLLPFLKHFKGTK